MSKIIINADDFGICNGINYGIVDCYEKGILTSTTLMVTMGGAEHAAKLAKQYPGLGIGLHLNITLGKPLTDGKSLVGDNGQFIKPKDMPSNHHYNAEEVYREFLAQYKRFIELMGRKPTHLDSHLFATDIYEEARNAAIKISEDEHLPIRNCVVKEFPEVKFWCGYSLNLPIGSYKGLDFLYTTIDEMEKNEYVEIMVHPGYMDRFIMTNSSLNLDRLNDVDSLLDSKLKNFLISRGNGFINYSSIISINQ